MTTTPAGPRTLRRAVLVLTLAAGCGGRQPEDGATAAAIETRLAQVARIETPFDAATLPEWQRAALAELVAAGRVLDRAFWEQSSPGAWEERRALLRAGGARAELADLVALHAGPFDRFDGWEPFLGPMPRSPGGGFYPPYLTPGEIERYLASHPEEGEAILAPLTVVARAGDRLAAIPYHDAYGLWLRAAAARLRVAAGAVPDAAVADAWRARADALEGGDWTLANGLWVGLPAGGLEAILGPYGLGDDRLAGVKASWEAMVGVVDEQETLRLEPLVRERATMTAEMSMPIVPAPAQVVVAAEAFRGGRSAYGRQPVAFTLSGEPGVRAILWSNRIEARRRHLLEPLSRRLLADQQAGLLTAEGGFALVALREIARSLAASPAGTPPATAAGATLEEREARAVIDEARAAALGLWCVEWFARKGMLPEPLVREHHAVHLADLLAAARPADGAPAGRAAVLALNWHRERGAIRFDPSNGRWSASFEQMLPSATELAAETLAIAAGQDAARAARLVETYGIEEAAIRDLRARTADVPLEVYVAYRP
jgi:hypothetical protein